MARIPILYQNIIKIEITKIAPERQNSHIHRKGKQTVLKESLRKIHLRDCPLQRPMSIIPKLKAEIYSTPTRVQPMVRHSDFIKEDPSKIKRIGKIIYP